MKKIIIGVVFLISNQLLAQITFGPKVGLAFSRENFPVVGKTPLLAMQAEENTRYILVPTISGVIDIPLSKTFSIRPEIGYRKQGYSYINQKNNGLTFTDQYQISDEVVHAALSYLEIPVNVSIKLPVNERRIEILVGATFGRCIGGNGTYSESVTIIPHSEDPSPSLSLPYNYTNVYNVDVQTGDIPDGSIFYNPKRDGLYVNPYNFNLNFGAGYRLGKAIVINAMFNYGLSNMLPNYYYTLPFSNATEKQKNGYVGSYSYSLSVAYMFHWKKNKDK